MSFKPRVIKQLKNDEYRYNCIKHLLDEGKNIQQACNMMKLNRITYYRICQRLNNNDEQHGGKPQQYINKRIINDNNLCDNNFTEQYEPNNNKIKKIQKGGNIVTDVDITEKLKMALDADTSLNTDDKRYISNEANKKLTKHII